MDLSLLVTELRYWVPIGLATAGAIIALRTYRMGQEQRRLENSFRLLELFYNSLKPSDTEEWTKIFQAAAEPAGARRGHFVHLSNGEYHQVPFEELFAEGPPDNGAIDRIASSIEMLAYETLHNTATLRVIYFDLGQMMNSIYFWLSDDQNEYLSRMFKREFPSFALLYESGLVDDNWPKRVITRME